MVRVSDHQSYVSEFAKDMARKQEEKNVSYNSDFVGEMVGSLTHKNEQGIQVCDAKEEENNYVNGLQHGNELIYNYMRRYDANQKVGRKLI